MKCLIAVLGLLLQSQEEAKKTEVRIEGFNKPVMAYFPEDYDPKKKYGIVFWLHGTGGDGDKIIQWSRVYSKSRYVEIIKAGYILVCPSSNSQAWGVVSYDWRDGGWGDVPLVAETVQHFLDNYSVDRYRVHMAGFSAGSVCIARSVAWSKEFTDIRVNSIMCHSGGMYGKPPAAREEKAKETRVWILNGSRDKAHDAPTKGMAGMFERGGYEVRLQEIPDKEHIFPVIEVSEMLAWWQKLDEPFLKRGEYEKLLAEARAAYKEKDYATAFGGFNRVFRAMNGAFEELSEPAAKGMAEIEKKASKLFKKVKKYRRKKPDKARELHAELKKQFPGTEAERKAAELLQ